MSPAERMNDQHECMGKNDPELREKLVSASFSFGDEDNMAMWAMYGIPWEDGVRITIPRRAMEDWLEALRENRKWQDENNVENISLHDIAYYQGYVNSGKVHLRWARGKCHSMLDSGVDIAKSSRFTGYIKNFAWKQESEARLVVTLKEKSQGLYIPVPESVLKRFKICIGPMVVGDTDGLKSKILQDVEPQSLYDAIYKQTEECFFRDRVNLKRPCGCEKSCCHRRTCKMML